MPVKHGPKGMRGEVAKDREEYGTPYSVGEARAWLVAYSHTIDIYPRELMEWLCDRVEELEEKSKDFSATAVQPVRRPPGVPLTPRTGEKRRK